MSQSSLIPESISSIMPNEIPAELADIRASAVVTWCVVALLIVAVVLAVAIVFRGCPPEWALLLFGYVWIMCIIIVASEE